MSYSLPICVQIFYFVYVRYNLEADGRDSTVYAIRLVDLLFLLRRCATGGYNYIIYRLFLYYFYRCSCRYCLALCLGFIDYKSKILFCNKTFNVDIVICRCATFSPYKIPAHQHQQVSKRIKTVTEYYCKPRIDLPVNVDSCIII